MFTPEDRHRVAQFMLTDGFDQLIVNFRKNPKPANFPDWWYKVYDRRGSEEDTRKFKDWAYKQLIEAMERGDNYSYYSRILNEINSLARFKARSDAVTGALLGQAKSSFWSIFKR